MNTYLLAFARRTRLFWKVMPVAAIAALLLAACGGGTATAPTPTATTPPKPTATMASTVTSTPTVAMVKIVEKNERYSFDPASLSIKVGTQVEWLNTTDVPHTVTSDTAGTFASPDNISQNKNFKFTFTTAGTFPYHCNIHPYMKATITVTS